MSIIKVGFYFRNKPFYSVDCANLDSGNPGIGGTHFAMLQIAKQLTKSNKLDCYLLAESPQKLPQELNVKIVPLENDLPDIITSIGLDIIIVNRTTETSFSKNTIEILERTNVKVIVWAHVFMPYKFHKVLAEKNIIKRIVCVSKQQLFTLYDDRLYSKSNYIYNICDFKNPQTIVQYNKRKNYVVYLGAINYIKGVHLLTAAWPRIKKEIPDAQLFIIGGGNLYSRNDKLGNFNITEKYYEHQCLKPILRNNVIDDSVHFLGVLGEEKWEYLNKCKVGIVNTHYWETFGYTAVEMQLAGEMIASYKSPGLIDTVYCENGILFDHEKELAESIIDLLKKQDHDPFNGIKYIEENFSVQVIVQKWFQIIMEVAQNVLPEPPIPESQLKYVKWQLINKQIQKYVKSWPSLTYFHELYLNIRWAFFKLKQPRSVILKFLNF